MAKLPPDAIGARRDGGGNDSFAIAPVQCLRNP